MPVDIEENNFRDEKGRFKKGIIPKNKVPKISKNCLQCKTDFYIIKSRESASFCSRKCADQGLIGRPAWNKGKSNTWCIGEKNNKYSGGKTRSEVHRQYRARNTEKVKEWKRNYIERHRNDPRFILITNIRRRILKVLGRKSNRQSSIEFLGCSIDKLKDHLEKQFITGMTWQNHGLNGWHIDHRKPISLFNLDDPQEQQKAFHFSNLQPLWAKDNLIKSNKII